MFNSYLSELSPVALLILLSESLETIPCTVNALCETVCTSLSIHVYNSGNLLGPVFQ